MEDGFIAFSVRIPTASSNITSLILPPLIKPWVAQFLLTGRWSWVQTCCFISAWVLHVLPYNLPIFVIHECMSVAFAVSHMVLWLPVPEAPLSETLGKRDTSNGIEIRRPHPLTQHLLLKYNDINAKSLTACTSTCLGGFYSFPKRTSVLQVSFDSKRFWIVFSHAPQRGSTSH